MAGERPVRPLCWSDRTEREEVYPHGINGAVANALEEAGGFEVKLANLTDDDQGLTEDLVGWADVLIWFSHVKHRDVTAENVARVVRHIQERGMGYVPLHSSLGAEPFKRVLGHRSGSAGWREEGCPSVVSVVQRDHPIAEGSTAPSSSPWKRCTASPSPSSLPTSWSSSPRSARAR